jgi:hypothetical protein
MPGAGGAQASGVVLEFNDELRFMELGHVGAVIEDPWVSEVPGSPLGMALVEGLVVPVVRLGAATGQSLLCVGAPEELLLHGLRIRHSGRLPRSISGVLFEGRELRLCTPQDFISTPTASAAPSA